MRIGIDTQASRGRKTGLANYTGKLEEALKKNARPDSGYELRFLSRPQNGEWNTLKRLVWENWELPALAGKEKIDLLHVPAFAAPCIKAKRLVITVHDLIGMTFPNQMGWPSRFYWAKWLPWTVRKADRWIAVSESTKRDLIRYLGLPESRIRVIYSSGHEGFSAQKDAARIQRLKEKLGIRERYFIFVGTLEPRKNLIRVIDAFLQFVKMKRRDTEYQLIAAGAQDFGHGKWFQQISEKEDLNRGKIVFPGYLTHEELNDLYCGGDALLFPSLSEGFGFPVLEAMASGIPVLTSNISSLPEVAGEAALLVNPLDVQEMADAIERLADDHGLREGLVARGFQRIRRFSWDQTAQETLEVYESLF